ncbi:gluconate 2-dehydrogenase subunit 3 family protein [Paenibacillus nasutitermitis]|uniref:Oxidoreductase n=1 Tax=Paenibacillus nasutitermitis TaxID=1652958 RepID=A0A916ZEG9_9BACL|nr:gluconate 2-dehydrogenase subunit 3 family protein [Paenibacillus nasutitermitis]GGD91123.1 oxidoreductase [Paenibacillus nasutitermitis]
MSDPTTDTTERNEEQPPSSSRRNFLKGTGLAVGGLIVGGVVGGLIRPTSKEPAAPSPETGGGTAVNYNQALMYFNQEQFRIVDLATERLFPKDDQGPGAQELGVAYYIDHQLAGEWGMNGREYMQGPFFAGEKTQGYQGHLRRREIFEIALREMQNYSNAKFEKDFTGLAPEEQDTVLKAFENDEVKLTTISASGFFKMLFSSTMEGVYADPLYGGNGGMSGWKMKKFPGSQMAYTDIIEKEEFVNMQPVSLREHMAQ